MYGKKFHFNREFNCKIVACIIMQPIVVAIMAFCIFHILKISCTICLFLIRVITRPGTIVEFNLTEENPLLHFHTGRDELACKLS